MIINGARKHRPGSRNGSRKKNAVKKHKRGLYLGHRRCKCGQCMSARQTAKQRRFEARQAAGYTKRSDGTRTLTRYGKSQSGYRTPPGTPPNTTAQPRTPGTGRGRPAIAYNPTTKTWER